MPDLPQALDAALRARYSAPEVRTPVSSQRGLTARMNQLEKAYTQKGDRPGTAGRRAAAAAGVSHRTWQRWRAGTQKPGPKLREKLATAYDKHVRMPKLRRKVNAKGAPNRVTVAAVIIWNGYKNRAAHRSTTMGGMRPVMVATIRAWAKEGPEAAATAFEQGCAQHHNVPSIEFAGDDVEVEFP